MSSDIKIRSIEEVNDDAAPIIERLRKKYEGTEFYLDVKLAKKIVRFISLLKHTGGKLGGVNFQLLSFQVEFLCETLAVKQKRNDYRKHKTSILFVARKQGKTELLAALNIWMFFGDPEKQKEQYIIASETTQASILYNAMISMLKQSPFLWERIKVYKSEKRIERRDSEFQDIFRVLSAKAGTKDGLKPSLVNADEAHAYPDSALYDVLTEGLAHREQPLAVIISTAGYNKQGFFKRMLDYARQVNDGVIKDDSIYLMDFGMRDDEDWTDPKVWQRCNPALGYGVKIDYLRDKFHKAQHSATDEVSFRTKHLCQFVDSAITWIRSSDWKASNRLHFTEADLTGRECYAGLDLSSTTDLTAFAMVFPNEDGGYEVLMRFFIPEESAAKRSRDDKVPYLQWAKEGYITLTPGNVVDYEMVFEHILKDSEKFSIKEIAFDRWNALGIVTKLEENGLMCVGFGQGFKSMSSPVKAIEALVLQKKLNHGNNPVLTWNVSNVQLVSDAADNVKMDKSKAIERIDGAVALAMAIGRAEVYKNEEADWETLIV